MAVTSWSGWLKIKSVQSKGGNNEMFVSDTDYRDVTSRAVLQRQESTKRKKERKNEGKKERKKKKKRKK